MKHIFLLLLLPLFSTLLPAQSNTNRLRVMWYNVENLFDTKDNPQTEDDEFLPSGNRYWSGKRYNHKLQQIAKVITAAGEWDTPALIGLCEVENDSVLIHLLNRTPLRKQQYRFCLTTGSDKRGINVALLYQRDKFAYIQHSSNPVNQGEEKPTRDILHVSGRVLSGDTLDVFVCHFPSRSGGEKETEKLRFSAAKTLRNLCDSVFALRANPCLFIMGDFNDTPADKSMTDVLKAFPYPQPDNVAVAGKDRSLLLYNLCLENGKFALPGTHKYQGEWHQLDQIIINKELFDTNNAVHFIYDSFNLFAPSFLFKKDKTYRGLRPFRSFYGFKYEGGYSDHLPLILDLEIGERFP